MFKKLFLTTTLLVFSTPAWATTFEDRIEMPTWGDVTFHCQSNPYWTVAYYYHPTTGNKVVKYWEAVVINFDPYQEEYVELDGEMFRKKCGVNKYESIHLKNQSLQQIDNAARAIISTRPDNVRPSIPKLTPLNPD